MKYYDLAQEAQNHFPTHGWIAGCSGLKHLRLPILRLYQHGQPTYKRFIENDLGGMWLQCRSPYRTLRQLAIALRDLQAEIREILPLVQEDWHGREPSNERDNTLTRVDEGYGRIEISLIAAFVLLRRLADELIDASRPFLFEHWQSAPRKLAAAVLKARDGSLVNAKPICNIEILIDALQNHTSWLDRLRENNGIRDILIHKEHILQVGARGSKRPEEIDINWQISANLVQGRPGALHTIDLFPALVECIAGACLFMDRLYRSVIPTDSYQQGDVLFLTGSSNNIVGFWPSILAKRTKFPLTA
jgi:hypothetical protein